MWLSQPTKELVTAQDVRRSFDILSRHNSWRACVLKLCNPPTAVPEKEDKLCPVHIMLLIPTGTSASVRPKRHLGVIRNGTQRRSSSAKPIVWAAYRRRCRARSDYAILSRGNSSSYLPRRQVTLEPPALKNELPALKGLLSSKACR